ncbi:MAG: CvpA family protein, partial [bacterium]
MWYSGIIAPSGAPGPRSSALLGPAMNDFAVSDIIALTVLGGFFLRSFFRGALKELFSFLALAGGFFAAARYGSAAGEALGRWTGESDWLGYAGGGAVFVAVWLAVGLFGGLVSRLARAASLGPADRFGGGLIGLAKGVLIVSVAVAAIDAYAPGLILEDGGGGRVIPHIRWVGGYIRTVSTGEVGERLEQARERIGAAAGALGGKVGSGPSAADSRKI